MYLKNEIFKSQVGNLASYIIPLLFIILLLKLVRKIRKEVLVATKFTIVVTNIYYA